MKAIILAAGMGTRLGKYTENLPKGMLNFNGKTLIERQVETLRSCGINDITIVKGYAPDKIQLPNIKYYTNPDYQNTNMVATLFCAEQEMDDGILVCYSDIVYEKKVLQKILESKADIGVTADEDYLDYWKERLENWQDDMESLQIKNNIIFEIGTKTTELEKAKSRYVGLIKFSKKGVEILRRLFHENKQKYWDKDEKWLNSKSFKKAYMTDMLQTIINAGYKVEPILINRGWIEFDTIEDYEKAMQWIKDKIINKYIHMLNKKIAISQRVIKAEKGADRDALEQDYVRYYEQFGVALTPIPNVLSDLEKHLASLQIDGIILSGGNDINPNLYGSKPVENSTHSDERDNTERQLLDFAIKNNLPVLCECRGAQFLNVYQGGKLLPNLKELPEQVGHVAKTHMISITDEKFRERLGKQQAEVNSYHNQGFREQELGKELAVFAKTSDGVIEGIYHRNLPLIGIMWHPERQGCDSELNKKLIESFLNKNFFWLKN